jgi:cysteine-rich repeat protein
MRCEYRLLVGCKPVLRRRALKPPSKRPPPPPEVPTEHTKAVSQLNSSQPRPTVPRTGWREGGLSQTVLRNAVPALVLLLACGCSGNGAGGSQPAIGSDDAIEALDTSSPLDGGELLDAATSLDDTSDVQHPDGETLTCNGAECIADEACVPVGQVHPSKPCQVCEAPGTDFPWGYEHHAPCDDEDPCTPASFCNKDICQGVFAGSCCGNGTLEPGEACDDGNTANEDGCPSTCKVPAQRIAAGSEHTCAIRADSTVQCWGRNDQGQSSPPVGPFVSISAGVDFSCGIRPEGTLECWGTNTNGESSPPEGTYTMIESGQYQACALGTDGIVKCWGLDRHGCINDAPDLTFLDIASLEATNCGVTADQALHCWGQDKLGKLADIPSGSFVGVVGGTFHSLCAVRTDQSVACWAGKSGGLTSPDGLFSHVAVGAAHACGVHLDGTVGCWGANTDGQTNSPAGSWLQVACGGPPGEGEGHSCALDANGDVTCWGFNSYGQSTAP